MNTPRARSVPDWESSIRATLAEGHCFRAYDLCREALLDHPGELRLRLLAALASLRSGDVADAQSVVAPLADELESTESRVRRLMTLLAAGKEGEPAHAHEVAALLGRLAAPSITVDAGAAALMADICREAWRRRGHGDDLRRASDMASRAFALEASGKRAFDAAVLAELCDRHEDALSFAQQAVALTDEGAAGHDGFYNWVRHGLLALLQGEHEAAAAAFDRAGAASRRKFALRMPLRRELCELAAAGLSIRAAIDVSLPPPTVVLFSGPYIDLPGAGRPCFPPELEAQVAANIVQQLELMGAEIGYSCAEPGSDLLFVEAMFERDAEVNIVLPCAIDDFIEHRVRPAGGRWEKRFRNALKLASSVTLTTTDPLFDDYIVLQHNNRIIDGTARLRAQTLGCKPYLLAVWDYSLPPTPGSVADFIDHWADPAQLRIIDLDDLRCEAGLSTDSPIEEQPPVDRARQAVTKRVVRSMLFADIVGYSKLSEADLPAFWRYMEALVAHLASSAPVPDLVESWGDALYVVQKSAHDMAEYALALVQAFESIDSRSFGLPTLISVRIGLHTGPVFVGAHPLTGRGIVYGGQVNRAARIEPISRAGYIYASEQFVAALVAEESLRDYENGSTGTASCEYAFEYLGTLELAKNYGRQAVYMLGRSKARAPKMSLRDNQPA